MQQELLYQIALTMIPSIGPVQARILMELMEASEVFRCSKQTLERIPGIGTAKAEQIASFSDYGRAEKEMRFIEKFRIRCLSIRGPGYPKRLLNCYDAPTLLYVKGEADLDHERIVAVIGTRSNTAYGKMATEKLVDELRSQGLLVISGLAFGIDAIAHRAALKNGLPTVGVLAHGLDQVYPSEHQGLAREMVRNGGALVTEFPSNTRPERYNFPLRNRIVAGLSDVVVVAETRAKGGSMITAELANGYNREVFAIPGRINDPRSCGCNRLIRQNKAALLQDADDLIQLMNWDERRAPTTKQAELFPELPPDETMLFDILKEKTTVSIDELYQLMNLPASRVASSILGLELKNLLLSLPGKLYRLQER